MPQPTRASVGLSPLPLAGEVAPKARVRVALGKFDLAKYFEPLASSSATLTPALSRQRERGLVRIVGPEIFIAGPRFHLSRQREDGSEQSRPETSPLPLAGEVAPASFGRPWPSRHLGSCPAQARVRVALGVSISVRLRALSNLDRHPHPSPLSPAGEGASADCRT